MRSIEEQNIALECLKLADNPDASHTRVTERATAFYAFVTGEDVDDATRKLDAVRGVVSQGL